MLGRAKGGSKGGGDRKKGSSKNGEAVTDPFDSEEALSQALSKCPALSPEEQKTMILQVKRAAVRNNAPPLTSDQHKKIDADIQQLSAA